MQSGSWEGSCEVIRQRSHLSEQRQYRTAHGYRDRTVSAGVVCVSVLVSSRCACLLANCFISDFSETRWVVCHASVCMLERKMTDHCSLGRQQYVPWSRCLY